MRKLLLFFAMLTVSIGTWAGTITDNGNGMITLDGLAAGDLAKDPSTVFSANVDKLATATKVVFGSDVTLNNDDLAALKTLILAATQLKMDQASLDEDADISKLETAAVEYLQLPDGMTKEADVKKMATLNVKNSALKVVGAFDGSDTTLPELALYSFEANELSNFSNQMMNLADKAMVARLAGTYGDNDLVNNGPVFGWTPPCIWDFTGATFTSCTLNPGVNQAYYAYDNPFCEGGEEAQSKPGDNYQTNAFHYFKNYSTRVVDIKLPTGNTVLPPLCLNNLGSQNTEKAEHKAAFLAYYEITEDDLNYINPEEKKGAVIPSLTIPNNYVTLDYECGYTAHIQHLVIGGGVKYVQGGAFYDCIELEDLDFGAGLSDCYLSDRAFHGEANSVMKHIALSEGIVSVGYQCFKNAQHLESIRLPQTLINIGNEAFDNCLALNSITIPENVDKIGMDAFKLCPFTDIYLTTTDPNKIPIIFTGGNSFNNWGAGASFHHGHYDGWEALMGVHPGNDPDGMSWDDAVDWYFINANGLPVLHYPKELADKVRADISANYHAHTSDTPSLGLPTSQDMHARETAGGANVGTAGSGIYTRDGWAQFMLMKESSSEPGGDIYKKQYDDVWYTMCFPFDLTDEQLAGAFNETFNIVDFSGVEVKDANEETGTPKKLVLHFNNVAITHYKDTEGNIYDRKLDGSGKAIREKHTDGFEYNVYIRRDNQQEYHHAIVSKQLASNKTKTFAPGNALQDLRDGDKSGVVIIDGILAEAGHPYMIHPAIGVNDGGTNKKNCYFSGIDWKPMTQWPDIFEAQKRTVDLGVQKGTINESDPTKSTPDADNYLQAAYSKYAGQTYTFIGNAKEYRDDAQALGDEPQVPEMPVKPVKPTEEEVEALKPSQTLVAPSPVVQDPDNNSNYTDEFKELFNAVRCHVYLGYIDGENRYKDYTYGEDLISYESTDFLSFHSKTWEGDTEYYEFKNRSDQHNENIQNLDIFKTYLGGNNTVADLTGFNALKQLATDYVADQAAYATYKEQFDAYIANRAAWAVYNAKKEEMDNWNQSTVDSEYETALNNYNNAVTAHDTWEANAAKWKTFIPKNAYFLGRKTGDLPKYYREVAENPAPGVASTRKGGIWSQFTAIVIPNDAAVAGIESELDGKTASSKGFDMAFDEGFLGDFIEQDDVVTLIEKAQEEGAKVEYMDIVVSINGQVVRRGTTSLEGLPKGMYIINGKKYFVK